MKLLTVIVNYKTAEMTIESVESALRDTRGLPSSRVAVVDNDSKDGSFQKLQQAARDKGWGDKVEVMAAPRNGGFGYGNNWAMRPALAAKDPPEYIYLLNSDAFPDPGAIGSLLEFMDHTPRAGLAGSYLHGEQGDAQVSAFRFPNFFSELDHGLRWGVVSKLLEDRLVSLPIPTETTEVDWLAGASLMIRSEVLRQVGLFDETFFLYYEETDLCRRAKEAGWSNYYVPASSVKHLVSVSTGLSDRKRRTPSYWWDSREHYFKKSHGQAYLMALNVAWLAAFASWRVRRRIQGKPDMDPPQLMRDFVAHNFKLPKL